jgi:hypothetical protein
MNNQNEVRECEPSIEWVHVYPPGGWPKPEHWGVCEVHKTRWLIGQNLTEPPEEAILGGQEREKFFSEYREAGHCPGY